MFAIVICLVLLMCTLTIRSSVLCVLIVRRYVCVVPISCLVQPIGAHCCEVMYFGCFGFRVELGFLNCDDVCMCVVNKQFELLEFVAESVYVDLQYDEIYLTFTAGSVRLCDVSSPVVVLWSVCEVVVVPYVVACGRCCDCDACTVDCVECVCAVRVTAMLVWGPGEVWLLVRV